MYYVKVGDQLYEGTSSSCVMVDLEEEGEDVGLFIQYLSVMQESMA